MNCNNYFDMTDQGDSFETWQGLRGPAGPQGPAGQDGTDGSDGVTFTPAVSSAGVISWTNDGSLPNPDPVDIKGPQGQTGQTGPAGQDGTDGSNGVTFTPAVSSAGVISWTNDGGLPNPDPVNIKGPQGQTGQTGPAGQDGTDGSDGVTFTPAVSSAGVISWTNDGGLPNPESVNIKGPAGPQGAAGPQGPQGDPQTPSDAAPLMDGTPSAGSSAAYARGDHRHPEDINRAPVVTDTAFGSVASFPDGMAAPCKKLVVHIEPAQSGSGDPSPTNVRPISGWTSATVSSSGADTSDPNETVYSFPAAAGTVYGGTLTINEDGTGDLTVDKGLFAPLSWSPRGTENVDLYARVVVPDDNCMATPYACTVTPPITSYQWNQGADGVVQPGSNLYVLYMKFAGVRTVSGITEVMNSGNVFFVRELITPVVYSLTAQQVIDILNGTNNVWADCGDAEVTYRADTKLYIQKINAPTDDDMSADANIASGRYFIVGGTLYKSTAAIAAGAKIIPGTNCTKTDLAAALNALA